jgi:hypothetical protein
MATLPLRQLTRPHVIASAVLVTWACAKDPLPDPDAYDTGTGGSSAKPGTGGSSAQPGTGGSLPGSGGSSATGSGATGGTVVAGGMGGTSSPGGRSGAGGTAPSAGRSAAGGTTGVGGATSAGGATGVGGANATGGASTGGSVSAGGVANGGTGTAGTATGAGGTGMAGVPNDPNWKPPDMTATAKLVVYYQVQQKDASSYNVGMMLQFKNQTDAAYDLGKVTIRYWMSAEPAPMPKIDYAASGLNASTAPTYVGNGGNPYLQLSFKAGGTIPVYVDQNSLNNTNMSINVQAKSNTGMFDQKNDWSFDGTASAYKPNPKMTVYDNGVLIWGCEPSHVCATPDAGGEGGAGGQAP